MRRILPLLLLIISLASCQTDSIPKDIIQPVKMEKVLYDIHMVDGYINTMPKPDSAKQTSAALYKGVYKKHGIDSVLYTKSMDYYYEHPKLMSDMYERIKKKLEATKNYLNKPPVKKAVKKV
ncbi:MAG: DUF4296 domain-containing protein [Pedobacter sp.]|nr:MAG: DUF4296 domain-containing protein [Pedobacter sp.]